MSKQPKIITELIAQIQKWAPLGEEIRWSDQKFNRFARAIFKLQFEQNEPYRKFCQRRGVDPEKIEHYRDIPAAPTDVFKHVRLSRSAAPARTFRTSGTTLGARGEHHFGSLAAYEAALVAPFKRFCIPDTDQIRMLVIAPSSRDLPDSSLSFMLQELVERFGDEESEFFVQAGADGTLRTRFEALAEALSAAEAEGIPTMILGTSFGYVEFFDAHPGSWKLAAGSRLMETGGFKGKIREISRDELYEIFEKRLGISAGFGVSEYSMTELSSQAYSGHIYQNWREKTEKSGAQHGARRHVESGSARRQGALMTPPWARVELVDPLTFEPIDEPEGEGLIRWYDLANTESVLAVQTSDMGARVAGGGFRLLGRAPDAELRGCSLTIEEIVDAQRG